MSALPGSAEIARFATALTEHIGMQFSETKHDELGRVLHLRLEATGLDCTAYLERLTGAPDRAELAQLARDLTVNETYFLRHAEQFEALADVALPECARTAGSNPLHILSAGCASGEEAYSIAIMLRERYPQIAADIVAFDLNPAVLHKAERGVYSNWSLRACPENTRSRWFRRAGTEFELDASIRAKVRFEERNLADPAPSFWMEGRFDLIFCRNLLMYFSPEQAQAAVSRMAHALAPHGYLFLGHAETLRGISSDFHLCHTHEAFYYRRKDRHESATPAPHIGAPASHVPQIKPLAGDAGWFDAIKAASARVHALLPVAGVHGAPPEAGASDDGDTLLLNAVNASHDGRLDEAEALCRSLLAADDMSAGAHYVLALCHEGRGQAADAFEHDRIAAYLDPGFAMPRLHMGLSLRRAGQRAAAKNELEAAATLLQLEDPARVLLFGGGFQREALIALCRAELDALEARA
jgi:chemotaxis protein methyltransferase CheR